MTRSLRSRLAVGALVASFAVGGLAACSSDDGGGASAEPTFVGLLGLVPDTDATRENVLVQRYDVAEAGAAPWKAKGSEQDRELTRLNQLGRQTGVGPLSVMGGSYYADTLGAIDFLPSDVSAGISAGLAPASTEVALVDADEDAVLDAAEEAVEGATREDVDGVEVVRWLDDSKFEPELETPVGAVPGQAGRLAWAAPGALAYTTTDEQMAAAIGIRTDDDETLADDEAFAAVAEALDEADAYAALLTAKPFGTTPSRQATPERTAALAGGTLDPYAAIGIGGAWGDDGLELLIVLAHDDDETAEANAAALERAVADGRSARTNQPWADLLTDADIEQDGSLVVARFAVESPGMWQQLATSGEPLIAVR